MSVDDLVSLALGSPDFTPTSVAGVGDEALVVCFGENDGQPTFVYLATVSRREWLENSGLRPAWRAENCHSTGVGPVCEPSVLTDVAAATVRVGGGRYEGVTATVLAAFRG